jgi:hypothetical protein
MNKDFNPGADPEEVSNEEGLFVEILAFFTQLD